MKRILKFAMIAVLCVIALALFGLVVMELWNWLTPALFGWRRITYWQGVGVIILTRILFGRWGASAGRGGRRRQIRERWEEMTPEEREKFRQGICGSWGRVARPDSETGTSS
ncbi:MAG TPA: hypothetical protein VEJ67_15655 [Candidatus Cybelea sp.]|nr:hypothetical protein [Candidatus Cybelea sp.]